MLHVDIPSRDELEGLIRDRGPARVSLYLPTSPINQHAQADRIALKNQANEALGQLTDLGPRVLRPMEEMLFDLIDDDAFWASWMRSPDERCSPARECWACGRPTSPAARASPP